MRHVTFVIISPGRERPRRVHLPLGLWRCIVVLPALLVLVLGWLIADRVRVTTDSASLRQRVMDLTQENARLDVLEAEVARLSRAAYLLENIAGNAENGDAARRYGLEASRLLGIDLGDSATAGIRPDAPDTSRAVPHRWPVAGQVTAEFGARHPAIDIAATRGTPVRAAASGTVEEAGTDSLLGRFVVIRHQDGYVTTYGHNSHFVVVPGQAVRAGDVIAFVGSSGQASGPHLHYEVSLDGQRLDPRLFLPDTP